MVQLIGTSFCVSELRLYRQVELGFVRHALVARAREDLPAAASGGLVRLLAGGVRVADHMRPRPAVEDPVHRGISPRRPWTCQYQNIVANIQSERVGFSAWGLRGAHGRAWI